MRKSAMRKCQNCQFENEDLMSFCLECGTPLANLTAPLQNSPTVAFNTTPTVFGQNSETETIVGKQSNFTSNFEPPTPTQPKNNKTLLLLGGIVALLFLVVGAISAVVVYNLIPPPSPTPIPLVKTPTPTNSPTPAVKTPTPQVSFTPPTEPTKKGSFTIYANAGWQLSNIDVVSLEEFTTSVQGKIDVSGVKTGVSSSGVNDAKTKVRRIYPEFPTGALLMRTRYADGKYSNVVAVTAAGATGSWQNYPDEVGKLEFCVNDNAPESNGGQFTVTATMTRVPKPKK
jgi:hypothetical protein